MAPKNNGYDRLAAFALASERRAVTLNAAQSALERAIRGFEWESVADLRNMTIPVFEELVKHVKQMGAATACDIWDAFVSGAHAELYVREEPGRAEEIVRAAARLINDSDCSSFIGELQRQLQIIYDESKAVCMDGQKTV